MKLKLFEHIVGLTRQKITDFREYYPEWCEIVDLYGMDITTKAWHKIKIMPRNVYPDPYFDLHTWGKVCREVEQQAVSQAKTEVKLSYVDRDRDMSLWRENLNRFISQTITRKTYLAMALETGQMTPAEYNREMELYKKHGMPLDGHCKSTLEGRV